MMDPAMETDEALLGLVHPTTEQEDPLAPTEHRTRPAPPNTDGNVPGTSTSRVTTPNIHYSILLSEGAESPEPTTTNKASDDLQKAKQIIAEGTSRLKKSLIVMIKADHHRGNMKTAATTGACPKGMQANVPLMAYAADAALKKEWDNTLSECSQNLLALLINHYEGMVRAEIRTQKDIQAQ
jgi:hypothetical protein